MRILKELNLSHLFFVIFLCLVLASPALGDSAQGENEANRMVTVEVKGMVCEACSEGLIKKFGKLSAVEKVDVSVEAGLMTLSLEDSAQVSDEKIAEIVHSESLELGEIKR